MEGDFPLTCFPDILPPGLSWAQGSASVITLPQPRNSVGYESGGGPLRGRGEQRPRQRGLVVAWDLMETGGWTPFTLDIRFLIPRVGRNRVPRGTFPQELLRRGGGQSLPPGLGRADSTVHSGLSVTVWWINRCVNGHKGGCWLLSFSLQFSSVQSLSSVQLFATPWIAAR